MRLAHLCAHNEQIKLYSMSPRVKALGALRGRKQLPAEPGFYAEITNDCSSRIPFRDH
jgi:hypothetical protein